MKSITIICLSALLICLGCNKAAKWDYKTSQTGFKVEIPDYLTKENDIEDTDLAYGNVFKDISCAFIKQLKDTAVVEGFELHTLQSFNDTLMTLLTQPGNTKLDKSTPIKIDKLNAIRNDLTVDVEGEKVYMAFVSIESETAFYKIIVSVKKQDREKYSNDINRMIGSFREI